MVRYAAVPTFALCAVFLLGSCQDKKAQQENAQLQGQVVDLQKQLGDMGNRVDEATKARDELAKQNAALKEENNRLKGTSLNRRRRRGLRTLPFVSSAR